MKNKRILSTILCIAMVLCTLFVPAYAETLENITVTAFDMMSAEIKTDEQLPITLSVAGYDENRNTVFSPCEGAAVTVNGEQTVPAVTAPVCVVTVEYPLEIAIIHNIAKKYSQDGVVSDGNMLWLLADLAVYAELYPESENLLTDAQKQACLDKIIEDAATATAPAALSKTIIALRALGYDAKNVYTSDFQKLDIVNKLTSLVDERASSVTNTYTLPYVIIALQQGTGYATEEQINYLIEAAIADKASWQSTTWGPDGATPMIVALAPYYSTNENVKTEIDKTIPLITALQQENGLISNAASSGLAIAAFSALNIDTATIVKNEKSLIDGLMTQAADTLDSFKPTTNSFSTEQGLRGLRSWQLIKNGVNKRIFDFTAYPMNEAHATWAQNCPVSFTLTPSDAVITIENASAIADNKFDLEAGTYNYTVSKAGYRSATGSFEITSDEAANHTKKVFSVSLAEIPSHSDNQMRITVKVMVHDKNECNNSYTYKSDTSLYSALVSETFNLDKGQTVFDALVFALDKNNIPYVEGSPGYISSINETEEFNHGSYSGWMFTVNGNHQNTDC